MSNHLAIATVTATLQRTLQAAVQADVYGARVTTMQPANLNNSPSELGVNLFLYQVSFNSALHNLDATPFRSRGTPSKRQAALDLYYLLSFYGDDSRLEPQRLLGSTVQTLNDLRVISADTIQRTLADSSFEFLTDSNLGEQVKQLNILPIDLSLENLSQAWSTFFQTPYMLSVVYKVLVVLVEGKEPWKRALPVRGRNLGGIVPFPNQPKIEQVTAVGDRFEPILENSTLQIQGRNLDSDRTRIRIGNTEATPTKVENNQLQIPLTAFPPAALQAGVQSLQVIHQIPTGIATENGNNRASIATQPPQYREVESNVAPFVLCPTIAQIEVAEVEQNLDDSLTATVTVQLSLTVGAKQRVLLALNQWSTEDLSDPAAYLLDTPKRDADTRELTIPIERIQPGEYLARISIDGAESQLEIDRDRDSPTFEWFIGPKITIT
ncbi:MAG: DUF4255 domain-containing protein [Jaaginema sp. PMC 1079.18]|nr:DUF4255 domain-containing protein [Jaaginema sp. PMC 1080.18]MEC4853411.1 DUF4255 domain-containing protein [Jaaginema sp. PMC 1079.18]MEC4867612.1 DUF4255 domain-containing protein [Jaaginema sp. PMC 1078.18]